MAAPILAHVTMTTPSSTTERKTRAVAMAEDNKRQLKTIYKRQQQTTTKRIPTEDNSIQRGCFHLLHLSFVVGPVDSLFIFVFCCCFLVVVLFCFCFTFFLFCFAFVLFLFCFFFAFVLSFFFCFFSFFLFFCFCF